jgi:peptide/nickel transport system permease protein
MADTNADTELLPVLPQQELPEARLTESAKPHSLWWYSWKRLKKNRLAMIGLVIVSLLVLVAIFADFLASMDPNRQILEYVLKPTGFRGNVLMKKAVGSTYQDEPIVIQSYRLDGDTVRYVDLLGHEYAIARGALVDGGESDWHQQPFYILGTDKFGRDQLSRLLHGARISLFVGLCAEVLSLLIGVTLGAFAGYFRHAADSIVMYFANVVWSFPFILLVIAFSLVLGQGIWQSFVAIGVASWVDVCRIVRGQFFSLRETEYVEATRAVGFGSTRTIFRHMLPNAVGPITVIATAGFASAIIAEASLSFLGLGVQPPQSSWGQMIHDGYGYIAAGKDWGLTIYPSIAIALAVFGFNMLGDGLRDALDPKLKA